MVLSSGPFVLVVVFCGLRAPAEGCPLLPSCRVDVLPLPFRVAHCKFDAACHATLGPCHPGREHSSLEVRGAGFGPVPPVLQSQALCIPRPFLDHRVLAWKGLVTLARAMSSVLWGHGQQRDAHMSWTPEAV